MGGRGVADEGRADPKTINSGPLPASQRNVIKCFRWRADDGPTFNAGLVAL